MKHTKIETACRVALCAVFLTALFGILLLTAEKTAFRYQQYSYFENRNLAPFPALTWESLLDGSFSSGCEDWFRDHMATRSTALKYHTLLNLDVLKRPVVNDVVIQGDLYLPYHPAEQVDEAEIRTRAEEIANRLQSHAALAEELGAKFYYVAVPCQYVFYEDAYPWYLNSRKEYTEASCQALFRELKTKGVSYIDMRERFLALGNPPEFSSKVDNHYSIFGAFETCQAILERYRADTGTGPALLNRDEYTLTELPNPYVGSRTRKLLSLRQGEEKLSILTPLNEVPFTRQDFGTDEPTAQEVYRLPQSDAEDVLYQLYMGGDIPFTRIETGRSELPSILIYGDSFTNAVESLLWYRFDTMYSLDLRSYADMTLEEFIRQQKPDLIVCIRDYEALLQTGGNGQ